MSSSRPRPERARAPRAPLSRKLIVRCELVTRRVTTLDAQAPHPLFHISGSTAGHSCAEGAVGVRVRRPWPRPWPVGRGALRGAHGSLHLIQRREEAIARVGACWGQRSRRRSVPGEGLISPWWRADLREGVVGPHAGPFLTRPTPGAVAAEGRFGEIGV